MKYNIQDCSPDAPLGKIFARMNAIQHARYIRPNPPAAIYYRYDSSGWVDVTNPQDAIIAPGANVQTVAFWNRLYELCEKYNSTPFRNPPANGDVYAANEPQLPFPIALVPSRQYINDLQPDGTRRMVSKDVIGSWLIDDLVAYLNKKRFFRFDSGNAQPASFEATVIQTNSPVFTTMRPTPEIALQTRTNFEPGTGQTTYSETTRYTTTGGTMTFDAAFSAIDAYGYAIATGTAQAFGLSPGSNMTRQYTPQECASGVQYDRSIISPTYSGESASSIIGYPPPNTIRSFDATAIIIGVMPEIVL